MNNCATCVYWNNPWPKDYLDGEKITEEVQAQWGTCVKIAGPQWYEEENPPERPGAAFVQDASDYQANLHTRSDFGCVLWEERT